MVSRYHSDLARSQINDLARLMNGSLRWERGTIIVSDDLEIPGVRPQR